MIEGVEPGSAASQRLFQQLQGVVSHFQSKARQQQQIGGLEVLSLHQAFPGGGGMRYNYNNGQETITVALTTVEREFLLASPMEWKVESGPVIAIDIVVAPHTYLAAEAFFYTLSGTGGPWWDQSGWTLKYKSTIPEDAFLALYRPTGKPGWAWVFPPYTRAKGPGTYLGASASGGVIPFDIMDHKQPQLSDTVSYGAVDYSDWISASQYTIPASSRLNQLEDRTVYNALLVAGLIGGPIDKQYEARSTGETTDERLHPLINENASVISHRTIGPDDSPLLGAIGAGFIAKPQNPLFPGTPPGVTSIDVYLSASNSSKSNDFPGTEDARLETDDPSFTYEFLRDLEFLIRVREYSSGAPGTVEVATIENARKRHFDAPGPGADQYPTEPAPDVIGNSGRTLDWKFAASGNWVDGGNEPSDPAAKGMGVLLAESPRITRNVAVPPPERELRGAAYWPGDVAGMTKVATIEWTPPASSKETGAAKITPT